MKTLRELLTERHQRILTLGGTPPAAVGSLEKQLTEADDIIKRITGSGSGKRTSLVESYQALGLSESEACIAAGVDKAVRSKDVNKAFNEGVKLGIYQAAIAMGLTEQEAKIFADPKLAAVVEASPFLEAAKK